VGRTAIGGMFRNCEHCGVEFKRFPGQLKRRFCSNRCSTLARGHAPSNAEIRSLLIDQLGFCEYCGWDIEPGALELHHQDGNAKHRQRENIRLLCPNCRAIQHFAHQPPTPR
jgi:hypothetical protein